MAAGSTRKRDNARSSSSSSNQNGATAANIIKANATKRNNATHTAKSLQKNALQWQLKLEEATVGGSWRGQLGWQLSQRQLSQVAVIVRLTGQLQLPEVCPNNNDRQTEGHGTPEQCRAERSRAVQSRAVRTKRTNGKRRMRMWMWARGSTSAVCLFLCLSICLSVSLSVPAVCSLRMSIESSLGSFALRRQLNL